MKIVVLLLALLAAAHPVYCQSNKSRVSDEKKELQRIQNEVERGQRKLDSLRKEEIRAQKLLSESNERLAGSNKVVTRLSSQLAKLKQAVVATSAHLDSTREQLDYARRRFLGNARQVYFAERSRLISAGEYPLSDVERNREIVYLANIVNFEYGAVTQTSATLENTVQRLDSLAEQNKQVKRMKEKREVSIALDRSKKIKQEKQLEKLRRGQTETADKVLMLQQSLAEMEGIIDRIERERRRQEEAELAARNAATLSDSRVQSTFAILKGRLIAPFRGKIVESFGNKVDPVRKLKSFSPGIVIEGKANARVAAVGSGKVAYAGNLRGYGNFVIIDHGDGYYSTTAGLAMISVRESQRVAPDQEIGSSAVDGRIKFELRHGRDLLDPVEWIALDAF